MTQALIPGVNVARGAPPRTSRTTESVKPTTPETAEPKGQTTTERSREPFGRVLSRKQNPRNGADDALADSRNQAATEAPKRTERTTLVIGPSDSAVTPDDVSAVEFPSATTGNETPSPTDRAATTGTSTSGAGFPPIPVVPAQAVVAPTLPAVPGSADSAPAAVPSPAQPSTIPVSALAPTPAPQSAAPAAPVSSASNAQPGRQPQTPATPTNNEAAIQPPVQPLSPRSEANKPAAPGQSGAAEETVAEDGSGAAAEMNSPVAPKQTAPSAAAIPLQPTTVPSTVTRAADAPKRNSDSIFRIESAPQSPEPAFSAEPVARTTPSDAPTLARPTLATAPQPDETPPAPQIVSRGLTAALAQRGGVVHIRLVPESLGEVRINMTLDAASVNVRIDAATPAAQQLLSDHLGTLRASLEARGLQVERIAVNLTPALASPTPQNQQHTSADLGQSNSQNANHDAAGSQSRGRSNDNAHNPNSNITELDDPSASPKLPANFDSRLRLRLSTVA